MATKLTHQNNQIQSFSGAPATSSKYAKYAAFTKEATDVALPIAVGSFTISVLLATVFALLLCGGGVSLAPLVATGSAVLSLGGIVVTIGAIAFAVLNDCVLKPQAEKGAKEESSQLAKEGFEYGKTLLDSAQNQQEKEKALQWLTISAKGGNTQAAYELGLHYKKSFLEDPKSFLEDPNTPQLLKFRHCETFKERSDLQKAAYDYLKMAAEQKNPEAAYQLGLLLEHCMNIKFFNNTNIESEESFKYFQTAAQLGHTTANLHLGLFYYAANDLGKALEYFKAGAKAYGSEALSLQGLALLKQSNTAEQGRLLLKEAAARKNLLAVFLLKTQPQITIDNPSSEITLSDEEVAWLKEAAERNQSFEAPALLGLYYARANETLSKSYFAQATQLVEWKHYALHPDLCNDLIESYLMEQGCPNDADPRLITQIEFILLKKTNPTLLLNLFKMYSKLSEKYVLEDQMIKLYLENHHKNNAKIDPATYFILGHLYKTRTIFEAVISPDTIKRQQKMNLQTKMEQAATYFRRGAIDGNTDCMVELGHAANLKGDYEQAFSFFNTAADQGNQSAKQELPMAHFKMAQLETVKFQGEAVCHLEKAADQNHIEACYQLALHYKQEKGTGEALGKATQYVTKAYELVNLKPGYDDTIQNKIVALMVELGAQPSK